MFDLKVTDDEIQRTLYMLEMMKSIPIQLNILTRGVYWKHDDISKRKVRLCIAELRKRGYLIIAKRGYSMAGDDPEPAIHFINGLYSRAYKLTREADIMFHELKKKYGDAVSEKVKVNPDQPMLDITQADINAQLDRINGESVYQKVYDKDGTLLNI